MKITELTPDDKNFNLGTAKGRQVLEKSISELGLGRSVLLDKDNNIIAGNKTTETARDLGISDVEVIETTGDVIVAVQRTDIDLNSKKGRELALADNVAAKENILFSQDVIIMESMKHGFDIEDWGMSSESYEPVLEPVSYTTDVTDDEVEKIQQKLESRFQPVKSEARTVVCPKCGNEFVIKI